MSLAQHKESLAALTKAGAATVTEVPPAVSKALNLDAAGTLKDLLGLVTFAKGLEDHLLQTAVSLGTPDVSADNRKLIGQIAASTAQRLAVLRAVEALLAAGHPELIALPPDAAKLPEAAGN